jgi:hypothetical protein
LALPTGRKASAGSAKQSHVSISAETSALVAGGIRRCYQSPVKLLLSRNEVFFGLTGT